MLAADDYEPNPRAVIGGNNPPADAEADFISARIVAEAAAYLRFRFGGLDRLTVKRKDARSRGFRQVLVHCLRGVVPVESLHRILDLNRKTVGEDQQRPERWAELDEAFDAQLEHVREAIVRHVSINVAAFETRLAHWRETDRELRALEAQEKAHRRAAAEAEAAAEQLAARGRAHKLAQLKARLAAVPGAEAIVAKHAGAAALAGELTPAALGVVEALALAQARGHRPPASTFDPGGLAEAVRLGLARNCEPHLSQATDPMMGATSLGGAVYLEAVARGLLTRPRRR